MFLQTVEELSAGPLLPPARCSDVSLSSVILTHEHALVLVIRFIITDQLLNHLIRVCVCVCSQESWPPDLLGLQACSSELPADLGAAEHTGVPSVATLWQEPPVVPLSSDWSTRPESQTLLFQRGQNDMKGSVVLQHIHFIGQFFQHVHVLQSNTM